MKISTRIVQIWAFVFKTWIINKRSVFSYFEIFFWPVVGLFSVGLLTVFLHLDTNTTGFILTGIVSMSLIQVCQVEVAYSLLYDLWSKCLKHLFVAPIRSYQLLLGSWLVGMIRAMFVFILLWLFSFYGFRFDFLSPGFLPMSIFLSGLFLISMLVGMSVCILVLAFGYKAEVAAWSLTSLISLVCGIYYPISILPFPLPEVARWIPMTYFLEYYRSFYGFQSGVEGDLLIRGFGLIFLYMVAEGITLAMVLRRAHRTGLLIKLSE